MPFARLLHRTSVKRPRSLKQRDVLTELTAGLIERANLEVKETYRFQIDRQDIIIPHLPDDFHGFTIAQLSDIHHSPYLSLEHLAEAVAETNALQPDVIVLTGDYVTHTARYVEPCAECLGRLRARFGVYAVLGNHDI